MDTSKIIKGVVNSGRYTVTAPIVKEDYGLYLQIEGVELPSTYEVDFSNNENSGTSVTMIGNSDGVLIPHQFIDTGKDVFAFLYHVGANYGRTVYKFRIPNKLRPDRTDETPTPEEQSVIDQAISALNEAVEQTAQDVIDADASAQSAQEYAEQAEDARDNAQTYSNNAQTSANNASASAQASANSATASAQSASASAQIKSDIEGMVDDAQGYAQASAQSATASANSATTAQGYANTASASAQSASTSASDALTYANTASSKASEASTSAQTASTKASESAQSASQALSYKTDAESAKTASQTAQGLAESARDSAVNAKTDAESARDDAETARDEAQQAVASISGALAEKAPVITDTSSGAVASFTDGADDLPLKSLVVDINPIQDTSSGDPSPTNICPISGWTGMEIRHDGKNLWDDSIAPTDIEAYSITGNKGTYKGRNLYLPKGTYTFSYNGTTITYIHGNVVNADGSWVSSFRLTKPDSLTPTFTLSDGQYAKLYIASGATTELTSGNIQLELGSTATSYEPYSGTPLNINLGQTVYGGKLDVLTGKLTVYPEYDSYNGETLTGEWISDRDVYAVGTTPTIGAQVVNIGAEGTEIQLDAHAVNSLLGQNNIWADSGDTTAEYRADTKLYIAKKIAEALASLT